MNILVFGAGENYWLYKKWFAGHKILAVLDNAKQLWYKQIDGYEIVPPANIFKYDFERIYILSSYVTEIKCQLLTMGIAESKIFFTYQLCDLGVTAKMEYYCHSDINNEIRRKRVLIITHGLTLAGANICLVYLAGVLVRNDFLVTVASPTDGALRRDFFDAGANVIIDEMLLISDNTHSGYMLACDILFVNTLQRFYLLRNRDFGKKTIWWLHEPDCLYKYVSDSEFEKLNRNNIHIYAVSEFARKIFVRHSMLDEGEVGLLPFGIPDERKSDILGEDNQLNIKNTGITFVIIGAVSRLKGHDVLLQAMQILHNSYRCRYKYNVLAIGDNQTDFAKQLIMEVKKINLEVEFTGRLFHSETIGVMRKADIVICASREECMPTFIVEGMMLGKLCITMDNTGIADYIDDGVNGFICKTADAEELANKMLYVMENYVNLKFIKYNARKTYERYFSMNSFENRIKTIFG